ncbi:hypothetical protein OIU77_018122 [Salix suchowensis]|uniref:Uncharacterized protein n=1 Tax=Salix suchowensis TaxID=1278906 RepID=A0ABQ8ZR52_9ROSI|nr:hypothetical protein OIU77_018122 [Salix suchowensis]
MRVKQAIQSLDAFPRAEEHLLLKTQSGAFVSVIGLVIMATLFYHELAYYLTTYTVHQMSVDLKRGEILPIHVNITFPSLPCDVVSVDAIDMSGKHEVDLDTNIWKLRLNSQGHITGTEYLSDLVEKEHDAHNHDHDKDHHNDSHEEQHAHGFDDAAETMIKKVKQALANGEGCRVYGVLDVQRVAGNFHISVHGLNILWKVQIEENGLKSIGYNLWKEDRACLQWLDTKEPKSVVYVNFGSVTVMTADQLVEFAMGLANSKISFLWIIRPDLVTGPLLAFFILKTTMDCC